MFEGPGPHMWDLSLAKQMNPHVVLAAGGAYLVQTKPKSTGC